MCVCVYNVTPTNSILISYNVHANPYQKFDPHLLE